MLRKFAVAVLSISLLSLSGCGSSGPRYQNVRSYSEGLAAVQQNNGKRSANPGCFLTQATDSGIQRCGSNSPIRLLG